MRRLVFILPLMIMACGGPDPVPADTGTGARDVANFDAGRFVEDAPVGVDAAPSQTNVSGPGGQIGICCPAPQFEGCPYNGDDWNGGWAASLAECAPYGSQCCTERARSIGVDSYGCSIALDGESCMGFDAFTLDAGTDDSGA